MRKVKVEFVKGRYQVTCIDEKVYFFKRGEEDKIVRFLLDYLKEKVDSYKRKEIKPYLVRAGTRK